MYQLVHDMRQHLSERLPARADGKPAFECVGYGHVGDGNLHLNIIVPKYEQQYLDAIEPFVFEKVGMSRFSILRFELILIQNRF
jgi:D-lactate dehydrogenase (cytochrome)